MTAATAEKRPAMLAAALGEGCQAAQGVAMGWGWAAALAAAGAAAGVVCPAALACQGEGWMGWPAAAGVAMGWGWAAALAAPLACQAGWEEGRQVCWEC